MSESKKQIESAMKTNPYKNVYWFARMLINNDKYGGIGKDNKLLAQMVSKLTSVLKSDKEEKARIEESHVLIRDLLKSRYRRAKALQERVSLFIGDLEQKLVTIKDIWIFVFTLESIMIPINDSLPEIPSDDKEFTELAAKSYLDKLGTEGLATVINLWDDLGVEGSLNAERKVVVQEFAKLRKRIENYPELETDIILTAFVQEFERRLSQKRKSRAGTSLEDVTSFIFKYFSIPSVNRPEHFKADIEVDKWIKCKDGWLIGISCKRTLRERWKQVSSADRGVLSRYKIKHLWHLMTYDEDLSDEKITTLGDQGHIFYLRDDSRKLINATSHIGMQNYVRPMSKFIEDIHKEID